MLLLLAGTRHFYGERLPRWTWIALGFTALTLYGWGIVNPQYSAGLLWVSAFMAAMLSHHFYTVWRHDHESFAARLMLVVLACMVVWMLARAVTAPSLPAGADLFDPSPLQSLYIGGYAFALMTMTVGCILLMFERLRQIDVLGRFGGAGFMAAVLPATVQGRQVAEGIRASRSSQPGLPTCSVSIGMATLAGPIGHQPTQTVLDRLIAEADHALYDAKTAGRDRAAVYTPLLAA
ncbi:diguanylate cyclase domain-containing protein [Tepidicella baoligensis]|uniref:diguanylate cyclase domain-containing protein n=1 Tax=Tepidicella baoligensis TaxID=2707016 RepID=UPI0015DAD144|nr:diguanylate cyclase [Tepidicella baoligensis]